MRDLVLENCRLDGRYDIKGRLGRGSYAEIFSAEDALASPVSAHKTVVIKALNVFLQNDLDHGLERTLVENFQHEAIALDKVRHPNIISRLGHGTSRDLRGTVFHFLILEYMPGGDLARYCRDNRVSIGRALDLVEQISAGLAHAHKQGIIHRDIKPQNLLLTGDRKIVKIADFGVARSTQAENPITRVGTNVYAPPEHSPLMSGQTANLGITELTPAADIYSLAKTAYVLFTGESPRFSSNKPIEELPHEVRVEPWYGPLRRILRKATQDDPRERYQDVLEFWRELSALSEFVDKNAVPGVTAASFAHPQKRTTPKAQVARGFSPMAPVRPAFDTSKNLKLKEVLPTQRLTNFRIDKPGIQPGVQPNRSPAIQPRPVTPAASALTPVGPDPVTKKPRRLLRAFAAFGLLLALFAGSLFATYNFFLGRPLFGGTSTVPERTAIATTDVNLRPAPTTANTPIGIVTRNSKVRIIRTSNKWHEVAIIQQGRIRSDAGTAERGWVYGDYVAEEK